MISMKTRQAIDSYHFYYCYYFFYSYCDQLCFLVLAPSITEWVVDGSINIWRQDSLKSNSSLLMEGFRLEQDVSLSSLESIVILLLNIFLYTLLGSDELDSLSVLYLLFSANE